MTRLGAEEKKISVFSVFLEENFPNSLCPICLNKYTQSNNKKQCEICNRSICEQFIYCAFVIYSFYIYLT